ncbi:unnamed protein product [Phaeothamnion confervicola]
MAGDPTTLVDLERLTSSRAAAEERCPFVGGEWAEDGIVRLLIIRLHAGENVETKAFLKPIFKFLQRGQTSQNDVEMAFCYVSWLAQLADIGDPTRNLPPQPHLQPAYAFNTLVTCCQRGRRRESACRAYAEMLRRGYRPEFFVHTAMIDVLSRLGDPVAALQVYDWMKRSPEAAEVRPNVVTFATTIRVAAAVPAARSASAAPPVTASSLAVTAARMETPPILEAMLAVLQDAEESLGQPDAVVYNAALAGCEELAAADSATDGSGSIGPIGLADVTLHVLRQMRQTGAVPDAQTAALLRRIDESLVRRGMAPVLSDPAMTHGGCGGTLAGWLETALHNIPPVALQSATATSAAQEDSGYLGCLGPSSSETLRDQVILHDLEKLAERLGQAGAGADANGVAAAAEGGPMTADGSASAVAGSNNGVRSIQTESLSRGDFETLIHQCRKRKWSYQVLLVLRAMETISGDEALPPAAGALMQPENGAAVPKWAAGPGVARSAPPLPPIPAPPRLEPSLRPALTSYHAALEALFDVKEASMAWDLFLEMPGRALQPTYETYLIMVSGALRNGRADMAVASFCHLTAAAGAAAATATAADLLPPPLAASQALVEAMDDARALLPGLMRGLGAQPDEALSILMEVERIRRTASGGSTVTAVASATGADCSDLGEGTKAAAAAGTTVDAVSSAPVAGAVETAAERSAAAMVAAVPQKGPGDNFLYRLWLLLLESASLVGTPADVARVRTFLDEPSGSRLLLSGFRNGGSISPLPSDDEIGGGGSDADVVVALLTSCVGLASGIGGDGEAAAFHQLRQWQVCGFLPRWPWIEAIAVEAIAAFGQDDDTVPRKSVARAPATASNDNSEARSNAGGGLEAGSDIGGSLPFGGFARPGPAKLLHTRRDFLRAAAGLQRVVVVGGDTVTIAALRQQQPLPGSNCGASDAEDAGDPALCCYCRIGAVTSERSSACALLVAQRVYSRMVRMRSKAEKERLLWDVAAALANFDGRSGAASAAVAAAAVNPAPTAAATAAAATTAEARGGETCRGTNVGDSQPGFAEGAVTSGAWRGPADAAVHAAALATSELRLSFRAASKLAIILLSGAKAAMEERRRMAAHGVLIAAESPTAEMSTAAASAAMTSSAAVPAAVTAVSATPDAAELRAALLRYGPGEEARRAAFRVFGMPVPATGTTAAASGEAAAAASDRTVSTRAHFGSAHQGSHPNGGKAAKARLGEPGPANGAVAMAASLPVLDLPLPPDRVVVVTDVAGVRSARRVFLGGGDGNDGAVSVVGVDAEWQPYRTGQPPSKVALLQLACEGRVFLLDLLALQGSCNATAAGACRCSCTDGGDGGSCGDSTMWTPPTTAAAAATDGCWQTFVLDLFGHSGITKLGLRPAGDLRRLAQSYSGLAALAAPPLAEPPSAPTAAAAAVAGPAAARWLDMASEYSAWLGPASGKGSRGGGGGGGGGSGGFGKHAAAASIGLAEVVATVLRRRLDKRMQASDWGRRPLTSDQLMYAALDAYCLLLVHERMGNTSVAGVLTSLAPLTKARDSPAAGSGGAAFGCA